jgi:hypothetical protein
MWCQRSDLDDSCGLVCNPAGGVVSPAAIPPKFEFDTEGYVGKRKPLAREVFTAVRGIVARHAVD